MCLLQWRLKDHWSPMVDDPAVQISLLQECVEAAPGGQVGVRCP